MIAFLVPQTLLVAVAFGRADYTGGEAGGPGFTLLSALVAGFACGSGAFVAARELRRAELGVADSLRTAVLPPAVVGLAIAVNGLASGGSWLGFGLVTSVATMAIRFGAGAGARKRADRR